jgi:hypothetical protein
LKEISRNERRGVRIKISWEERAQEMCGMVERNERMEKMLSRSVEIY